LSAATAPGRDPLRGIHVAVYSDALALGGAEVNLSRVLTGLPESVRVTIVAVEPEVLSWLSRQRPAAATELIAPIADRSDVRGILAHRRLFRRLGADVAHFNLSAASSCQWAILAATTVPGLKRIAVENSPMGTWSALSSRLKRFTSARLHGHVAVGTTTARLIEEQSGLPRCSVGTLYHGVPDVAHEPVERPKDPTVLTVARHDPVKGIDVLLEAMAQVPPPTRAVLIGDGSEGPALREQCARLGLDDRVEFRQLPWGEQRAADLMWAFDGLVLPSRVEGFPVTIAEAMLAGIPVVATDVGSVREAVEHGVTGWVVPSEDPAALAAAIGELVDDAERARRMGARAREVAEERFTVDATVQSYLELYRRVLDD
jgi:hypothetical protein